MLTCTQHIKFIALSVLLAGSFYLSSAVAIESSYPEAPSIKNSNPENILLPLPRHIDYCEGEVHIPASFMYSISPERVSVQRFKRAIQRLNAHTDYTLSEGASALFEVYIKSDEKEYPSVKTDESYSLSLGPSGIKLQAETEFGAIHGLSTLKQILASESATRCQTIKDAPRFPWRGILIDVVRHWIPPEEIKQQLDAMAAHKMNVLHWHLSDDQGFRVEVSSHPAMHEKGSDGNYYTQREVREIVEYAADRGIRVVPEFDLPGHSRSWQIAYPQLSSVPGKEYSLYRQESLFSDPLNPASAENIELIAAIIANVIPLFPDEYFHLGGDEVNTTAWENNEQIQQFMQEQGLASEHDLAAWFISEYAAIVRKLGKKPVAWDEVAEHGFVGDGTLTKWRTTTFTEAEKKFPVILSAGFYLDHMQSAWTHYRINPQLLPNSERANILGGEASAWSESVDASTIDMRIWPRTLAIAELLWSAPEKIAQQSESGFYERVNYHSGRLQNLGLTHLSHAKSWFTELPGDEHSEPLVTLAAVSRPVPFASMLKSKLSIICTMVGLNCGRDTYDGPLHLHPFVDHIPPESETARLFNARVARYLANREPADKELLVQQLTRWKENHALVLAALDMSPELKSFKLSALSEALYELADAGLTALTALESGKPLQDYDAKKIVDKYDYIEPEMSPEWFRQEIMQFENLFKPNILLQVKIPVQRGIGKLVKAAGK